jgi:hypothetical protein
MKLFTKEIDKKLFDQYSKGNNLEKQMVVAKIFNPYGRGTWYILNSDPEDSDYLWAIVDLFEVEIGSVLRSELESIKVPPFRLGLERDTSFRPINAKELYDGLMSGKHYAQGGGIDSLKVGDMVSYIRKYTGIKYKGEVIEIDSDNKYVMVKNTIGNIDYVPTTEVNKMAHGGNKMAKGGYLEYRGTITDDAIKSILQNDFPNANYQLDFNWLNGNRVYAQKDVLLKIRKHLIGEYGIKSEIEDLNKVGLPYIYIPNQIIEKMAYGGSIEDENREMVLNENNQIIHHTKELPSAIKGKRVPAWVVTKVHESASDLSDATHYMDGQKKAKGGDIESLNAPNSYLNIFTLGVKLPSQEKIVSSNMSPSHFSRKSLTLTLKGGSKEVIPEAKISDFLKGKQIDLRDTNGESYAIQLNRLKEMAKGGNISKREETQENNFGVTYKLGDKFNLGYNVSTRPNIEVSIVEIIPSGLFFKVNNSTKLFSVKTLQSKGSTISSGEYLVPINKMAKGGTLSKSQLKHFKEWMEDGNVSKNNDGTYSTQDAQYRNKLKDLNELKKYFKKEFAVDEYAKGGGVGKYYEVEYEINGKKHKSTYMLYPSDKVEKMLPPIAKIISIKETNKKAKGGDIDKTYSSAKTMGKESQDFKSEAIDYVGGIREWNKLTEEEKRQIIVDLEKDWDRNKYKKGGNVNKVAKVMHEFKEGNLHSGKSEKIVTNPKQAIAIALSEAKNNSEKKGWKHKK